MDGAKELDVRDLIVLQPSSQISLFSGRQTLNYMLSTPI